MTAVVVFCVNMQVILGFSVVVSTPASLIKRVRCQQMSFPCAATQNVPKGVVRELWVTCCAVFCRVLRPPGGGSSNLFGGFEDDAAASRKPHKMASNIFGTPEQPESGPKRSNPPGQNINQRPIDSIEIGRAHV